ncbi:MAG: hypothetical protein ACLSX2_03255 [Christensenellaceae bacterium]
MKRWLAGFVVLLMIFAPVMGLAEGDIQSFTAQATEDGSYIDITVIAAKPVTNAKITKGGKTVGSPGALAAGDDWSGNCAVDPSEAGSTVTLTLEYTDAAGQGHSQRVSVSIPQAATTPPTTPAGTTPTTPADTGTASASIKVSASETNVKQGENVKLTYVVTNTGDKTLSYVEVSEPSLGKINSGENLKPGEKLTFTYTLKNITQSFQSKPRLTYIADGKTQSASGNTVNITVATAKLTATLEVSKSQIDPGDSITLTGKVTNKGDITFKSVTISEKSLGELGSASNMGSGESKTVTKQVTPQDSAVYQLVVTAVDSTGKKYTYSSKSVTVKVADNPVPVTIDLTAQTDTVQLSEPGMVSFSIDVDNISNKTLSNVKITDQNDNTVQVIDELPAGSENIQYECMVNATTEFIFTATVEVDGVTSNFRSAPIKVTIANNETTAAGETTTLTETTTPGETAVSAGGGNTLTKVLIGLVVVIAIVITALIALVIYGNSIRPEGRRKDSYHAGQNKGRGSAQGGRPSSGGRAGSSGRRRR